MSKGVGEQHARSVQNADFGLIIGSAGPLPGMNIWPDHVTLFLGQPSCGSTEVDNGSLSRELPLRHLWLQGGALLLFLLAALEPGLFLAKSRPDGMMALTLHVRCACGECVYICFSVPGYLFRAALLVSTYCRILRIAICVKAIRLGSTKTPGQVEHKHPPDESKHRNCSRVAFAISLFPYKASP
jgi:hypothetical protein